MADRILSKKNFDADERWYKRGCRIVWFDRSIKAWTSYLIDDDGNQRTSAQYYANRWQFETCEDAGHFEDDDKDLAEAIDAGEWG